MKLNDEIGQYPNLQTFRTARFKKIDSFQSRKLSARVPGICHFVLGRLASWGEAPKLRPCSDLQIGLCYHALGVILYNYTTENLRIFPKTTVLVVSPYTRGF